MLAAWFGGSREGADDVAIHGARRDATGWQAAFQIARVRPEPHWNPVLFADREGTIHLFFKVGRSIRRWETWRSVSSDGGRSWSPPVELVPGDRGGRGPVRCKPIRLVSGRWLAGASLESRLAWDVFVDRSDDEGRHWTASDTIPRRRIGFGGKGVIQPTLWESAPGRVHLLARSTCGQVCRSDSSDGGETWSPIRRTSLPNNNSGLDLVSLDGGRLALVLNPVSGNWAARTPLVVAVSDVGGAVWRVAVELETGRGEYSYPAVVASERSLHVSYTWQRRDIAYCEIPRETLAPPASRDTLSP